MSESIRGLSLGAAIGANIITTGLLDCTLMLSYEHMVVLDEIIGEVRREIDGIRIDNDHLAVEVIQQEGKPGGSYLTCEHTIKYLPEELFISDYIGRVDDSHRDWYERANARVRTIFSDYPNVDFSDEIKQRALTVEARIKEDNQGWRKNTDDWWCYYTQDFQR